MSSISGSDTDDSSDSDLSEDEEAAGGQAAGSSKRAAKGQRGSTAMLQGPQVVLQTQGRVQLSAMGCMS